MTENRIIREAVGIFDDLETLQKAIGELERSGFDRRLISILGSEPAVKERFGEAHPFMQNLEDDPEAPRASAVKLEEVGVGQGILVGGGVLAGVVAGVIASGGMAIPGAMVTTALVGTGGGAFGAVLAKLLGDEYASFFQNQIEAGGLLLWVNTSTQEQEETALRVLEQYGARDVHVHDIQVAPQEEDAIDPQVCGNAFVRLDQLCDVHQSLLKDDRLMSQKLLELMESLKRLAANDQPVAPQKAQQMANEILDAAKQAEHMAEEEQRIVEEAANETSGVEEREAAQYFALRQDLNEVAERYQHELQGQKAA